jgi:hypothetical protein
MNQTRIIGIGLLYLFIFGSGVWLSRLGRPLNVILLTIHKLVSLAAVATLILTVYQVNRVATLGAIEWTAAGVTGLFFVGTIATGGLLSADKPMPTAVLRMHQIAPFLTVLSTGVTLYLLLGRT